MTLQTVTVTWDEEDTGAAPLGGYVSFQLTADLQDTAGGTDVRRSPAKTFFFLGPSGQSDPLVANDSSGITPTGTAYVITVAIRGQQPVTFTSQLNVANGATQTLAFLQANAAVPVTQYSQYLPLPSGTPQAGQVPVATGNGEASAWTAAAAVTLPVPAGTAAADTAAIQDAENALAAAGGGVLLFQPGTYVVTGLTKKSLTAWQGAGRNVTTVKLADGADTDVVQGDGFGTLTLSGTTGGIGGWAIRDMTIDGNKAGQSGTSYGLRFYGYDFDISNVTITDALSWGVYSEWSGFFVGPGPDINEEARVYGLTIQGCGQGGWHDRGPHDSRTWGVLIHGNGTGFPGYWCETWGPGTTVAAGSNGADVSTWTSGSPGTLNVNTTLGAPSASISATQGFITVATAKGNVNLTYTGTTATSFTGVVAQGSPASGSTLSTGTAVVPPGTSPNGGHCYSTNGNIHQAMHCYNGSASWQYQADGQVQFRDCIFEVATTGMALLRYSGAQITGGWIFTVTGAAQTGCGVQLGDAANPVGQCIVHTSIAGLANTGSSTASVVFANSATGNDVDVMVWAPGSPTTVLSGTPTFEDRVRLQVAGQSRALNAQLSFCQGSGPFIWDIPAAAAPGWTVTAAGTNIYTANTSSKQHQYPNGYLTRWYTDNYVSPSFDVDGATGHVLARSGSSGSLKPTVVNQGNGTGTPTLSATSSDTAGTVTCTLIASPTATDIVNITFSHAFVNHASVVITPVNSAAAQITAFVKMFSSAFTISAAVAPTAVGGQSPSWNYAVIGQDA